ncbi:hypothetical protein AHAS_Ahas19G0037300 [Arachis hypogaea]
MGNGGSKGKQQLIGTSSAGCRMKSCATSSHSFQPERPWPPASSLAGGATSGRKSMSWTSTMISFTPLNVHIRKHKSAFLFFSISLSCFGAPSVSSTSLAGWVTMGIMTVLIGLITSSQGLVNSISL